MSKSGSVGSNDRHPPDWELADLLDGTLDGERERSVRDHVGSCAVCGSVLAEAAADIPRITTDPDQLRIGSLPEPLRQALADGQVTAPAAGQLWRLRAGNRAELGIICRVDDDIFVAPATADVPTNTDTWTVQLGVSGTGVTLAAWISLEAVVGWEVLDIYLGEVDREALAAVRRAFRRGEEPPRDAILGRPVGEVDELREYREQLRSRFVEVGQFRLVPLVEAADDVEVEADVISVANAQGFSPSRLAEVLHMTPGQARRALGRDVVLTSEQVAELAASLGVAPVVQQAAQEPLLVRAVATPLRRRRFENVAEKLDEDEWGLRRQAVQSRLAMAARGSHGAAADWEELTERYLESLEAQAESRRG